MAASPLQPSFTVLIVDDDNLMRAVLAQILTAEGWQVHSAPGGAEALKFLEGNTVDVVVSDVIMPGLDGRELAAELGRRFPKLPVLLISGGHIGGRGYAGPFLPKPFSPSSLLSTIRELLAVAEKVS
jgi:two-component system, NtrC family, response regulator AtoC